MPAEKSSSALAFCWIDNMPLIGTGRSLLYNPPSSSFTPSSLSGLKLWLDPSDASTLFQSNAGTTAASANSDPVGYIADKSGGSFHLTSSADDTTRPLLQGVGSFPYLDFDGSNDKLYRTADLGLFSGGAFSIFVAVRGNPTANAALTGECNGIGLGIYMRAGPSTASTGAAFIRADDSTTVMIGTLDIAEANAFDNTDNVYGITDSGTVFTSYLDGTSSSNKSYSRSAAVVPTKYFLGAEMRGTGAGFFLGRVYGLIALDHVATTQERANIVTWLGAKVGRSL